MSFSKVTSAQNYLLKAHPISIETDISKGLHSFTVVGLPDKAVEESKDRVSAAIKNTGYKSPRSSSQKITISLAPADLKKEGPAFDLPIAIGYLLANNDIEFDPKDILFVGELSLDGKIRPITGALSYAKLAKKSGFKSLFLPKENSEEAALIDGIEVFGVSSLKEVIDHLDIKHGKENKKIIPNQKTEILLNKKDGVSLDDVIGQQMAKRGLEIAAAGGHNIALFGPPGTGKTMLAKALSSIMPPLQFEDMLSVTEIHSIAGQLNDLLITHPPVRSPHHTASYVSIVGGGAIPKPGEITLAHKGILFMDEFPEFDKKVLEALRQPLEDRVVSISRAKGSAQFPAYFILVAAMNPCPCGNRGIKNKSCVCSPRDIARYERKLSGPIMDRIDMWIEVSQVDHEKLIGSQNKEKISQKIKDRVLKAREMQRQRFLTEGKSEKLNSEMTGKEMDSLLQAEDEAMQVLNQAAKVHDLSARAYHRILRLARTIADLDESTLVLKKHILEALQYRQKHFKNE